MFHKLPPVSPQGVSTYFDLVGTLEMERGCSLSFVQFQPVCVGCKTGQATRVFTQIDPTTGLADDGASRSSGTFATDLEVVILPSWLDEGRRLLKLPPVPSVCCIYRDIAGAARGTRVS